MTRYLASPVRRGTDGVDRADRTAEVEVGPPLSRTQYETYRTVIANARWGFAPPIRLLGELLGLHASTAEDRLRSLEKAGYVVRRPGSSRSHVYRVVRVWPWPDRGEVGRSDG